MSRKRISWQHSINSQQQLQHALCRLHVNRQGKNPLLILKDELGLRCSVG